MGMKWLLMFAITAFNSLASYADTLAIVGGTLIDGTGGKPIKNGVLLIEDERITAVGDSRVSIPAHARRIDAKGQFVIPGLMNANVHLYLSTLPEELAQHEGNYEAIITEAAQLTLKQGVTTVFDSWGPRQALVNVREAISQGAVEASRLFVAGNIIGYDGPLSPDFLAPSDQLNKLLTADFIARTNAQWEQGVGRSLLSKPAAQVRGAVRDYIAKDIDFVKFAVNGHSFSDLHYLLFSPNAHRVIVEEARRANISVQTHTSSPEGLGLAIDAGVDLLQHCETMGLEPIPPALLERLAQSGIACGALVRTTRRLAWVEDYMPSDFIKKYWQQRDKNIRAMIKAGVNLVLATDGSIYNRDSLSHLPPSDDILTDIDEGHFFWLKAVDERGMKPMAALMAATLNIAKAYGKERDLGSLEVGKMADVLILDRNPLKNPEHYRRIDTVIKSGRIVDRDALPVKRVLTQP